MELQPNDGYPPNGGSLDSVGLLQQRSQWWGSTQGSLDPYTATWRFLAALPFGWVDMAEATACQLVQRSQYDSVTIDPGTGKPYVWAQNYIDRDADTNDLEVDPKFFEHNPGR